MRVLFIFFLISISAYINANAFAYELTIKQERILNLEEELDKCDKFYLQ